MEPRRPEIASGAQQRSLTHQSLIVVGIVAATITLIILFWYIVDVLMLVFGAALLAIVLRAPTDWLTRRTFLAPAWSLTIVLVTLVALLTLGAALFGNAVADQVAQLVRQLPEIAGNILERLERYAWLIQRVRPEGGFGGESEFIGRGLRAVTTTFGAIAGFGIAILMAVFFAAQPDLYVRGFLRLIPVQRRERTHEVLSAVGHTLRRWLVGQLFLMLIVAVLTTVGLWFLGIQFALALGMLAGLLTFIPYLGPILSVIPAGLVALAESPLLAGYVVLLYVGVQSIEGMLEPIVQQRAVYLPPVLLLFAQVVLGILVGALGVVLATPLAAAAMVVVNLVYVEDVLGDRPPGEAAPDSEPKRARRA